MPKPSIPVRRFGQIVEEAEAAYKNQDYVTIGKLNQELATINAGLFWQDGVSYLLTLNVNEPLPFDEPDESPL